MIAPDLSEHLGPVGELFVGLIGLLLLAMIHKSVRRFARDRLTAAARLLLSQHQLLSRKSAFYKGWSNAFHFLFQTRRDLIFIVFALTTFDYLSSWHIDFMTERFGLYPDFSDIGEHDYLSQIRVTIFSATMVFSLLRTLGYTLFCWLAFKIAANATYQDASRFRPLQQLCGLFLCISGAGMVAETLTPYFLVTANMMVAEPSAAYIFIIWVIFGALVCLMGAWLLGTKAKGAKLPVASAITGYLLLTHLLQWLYYFFDRGRLSEIIWLRVAEYHASNFTLTLLWNVLFVVFAIRLANPSPAELSSKTSALNETSNRSAHTV